jgi:hypothetical protein
MDQLEDGKNAPLSANKAEHFRFTAGVVHHLLVRLMESYRGDSKRLKDAVQHLNPVD